MRIIGGPKIMEKFEYTLPKLIDLYKIESNTVLRGLSTYYIVNFVKMIFDAYENERTIYACGNGGNVASVQNLVVDLNMHPFVSEDKSSKGKNRNHFKAVSLCSDQAVITGITNDLGYDKIFKAQLEYQAEENDILFGMSGSGNSGNVVEALKYVKSIGMKNILMTRSENTKCDDYADLVLRLTGTSKFPGQTGGNNNNFHYEDCISKVTHMAVGLLKEKVQNEN